MRLSVESTGGGAAPALLRPCADAIPAALRERARWAPWRAEWNAKKGKYDKIPHRPDRPEFGISTSRPKQWARFPLAWSAYERGGGRFAGVGYCLTEPHGVVGVDLDNCIVDGVPAAWAAAVLAELGSYAEVSPSGKGYRVFGLGEIPHDWNNHDVGIEVYAGHEARFLTVTGAHVPGTPAELVALDPGVLAALAKRYAKERVTAEIINLALPDLLDEITLPDVARLALPDRVARFLADGECDGDRSGALHGAGVALYLAGLDDATVLSLLAANEHAMAVALDHRRQDHDRALLYLWREHCVKAKGKAAAAVAHPDEFNVVGAPAADAAPELPRFKRDTKGRIEAIVENVTLAVQRPDFCGLEVRYDEFRDEIMCAARPGEWQAFRDHHYVDLRLALERRGFKPIGRELIRDVVDHVAQYSRFDTAILWLRGLAWDGVHRVDDFFSHYFGAEDTAYTRAASRYVWTALAGRVLEPGVKADMVPILVGGQGLRKSTAIEAMAPSAEFFTEVSFHEKDDDQARRLRGRLVAEISELRGLQTRERESILAFISRTHERWVPKYREFAAQYPRRTVFLGTTNRDQMLPEDEGHRRWLPVAVQLVDLEAIRRDRDQLWAEAAVRYELAGVEYQDAEHLAPMVHERHRETEPWAETISRWLDEADPLSGAVPREREFLQVGEVARGALRFEDKQIGRREEMRIGNALRECGFLRVLKRINGRPVRVWTPSVTTCNHLSAEVVTEKTSTKSDV